VRRHLTGTPRRGGAQREWEVMRLRHTGRMLNVCEFGHYSGLTLSLPRLSRKKTADLRFANANHTHSHTYTHTLTLTHTDEYQSIQTFPKKRNSVHNNLPKHPPSQVEAKLCQNKSSKWKYHSLKIKAKHTLRGEWKTRGRVPQMLCLIGISWVLSCCFLFLA